MLISLILSEAESMQSTIAVIFLLERVEVAQGKGSEKEEWETVNGAKGTRWWVAKENARVQTLFNNSLTNPLRVP